MLVAIMLWIVTLLLLTLFNVLLLVITIKSTDT